MSAAQRVISELSAELEEAKVEAHECRKAFMGMRAALKESQAIVREQAARLQMAEHAVSWAAQRKDVA